MRLPIVEVELSAPLAIKRLVRNIVTADVNVAAKMHLRLCRSGGQAEGEDTGEKAVPRHIG